MSADLVLNGLAAAAFLAVAVSADRLCHFRSSQLATMDALRDKFFKASNNLVLDDDVPAEVLDRLAFMANHLASPRIVRFLFRAWITGDLRKTFSNPPKEIRDFQKKVHGMRRELREQYGIATRTSLFAATYTNLILGPIMRRMILFAMEQSRVSEDADVMVADVALHEMCSAA